MAVAESGIFEADIVPGVSALCVEYKERVIALL